MSCRLVLRYFCSFFFFSSRRRHTRLSGDWSSDVCSSDLFSRGRSGGLVFPSPSEFSTVYCDPHNQRLWHSQQSKRDVFLELSCFCDDPVDAGNLISGSSAFSKASLNIWKFTVHILLKPAVSCKDGLNKGQKWYGSNRSR